MTIWQPDFVKWHFSFCVVDLPVGVGVVTAHLLPYLWVRYLAPLFFTCMLMHTADSPVFPQTFKKILTRCYRLQKADRLMAKLTT